MDLNTLLPSKFGAHVKGGYYYCDFNYLKSLFLLEPFLSVPLSCHGWDSISHLESELFPPFSF